MIDHIEIDFRPKLGPVRDQGQRLTCLAHATSAAHEWTRSIPNELSAEYLRFFAIGSGGATDISIPEIAGALKAEGQPVEADCPYLAADPSKGWTPAKGLTVFKRDSAQKKLSFGEVQKLIKNGKAPVLGISLPMSFLKPQDPWVITTTGATFGLHAIVGVGLGQHGGSAVVLIRNSWGSTWADGGHAWLSEKFLNAHLEDALVLK